MSCPYALRYGKDNTRTQSCLCTATYLCPSGFPIAYHFGMSRWYLLCHRKLALALFFFNVAESKAWIMFAWLQTWEKSVSQLGQWAARKRAKERERESHTCYMLQSSSRCVLSLEAFGPWVLPGVHEPCTVRTRRISTKVELPKAIA